MSIDDGFEIVAELVEDDLVGRNADKKKKAKKPPWEMQGAWTGNNNLGFEVPFDLSVLRPQAILQLPEWGMPDGWTLSVRPRIVGPDLVANQAFDALLEVDFGSGGIVQSFECDLVVGTRISLPMNALVVKARLVQLDAQAPSGEVKLSALLARGFANSYATRQFRMVTAATAGSTAFVPIPPFARSVQILPVASATITNTYAATVEYIFAYNTAIGLAGSVNGDQIGVGTRIPIPTGARYFFVRNNSGAITGANAIFSIFDYQ